MENVIAMLQALQGMQSLNSFAKELGIWPSTLWRYYRGEREMNLATVRKLVRHFTARGEFEAVTTLNIYAMKGMYTDE